MAVKLAVNSLEDNESMNARLGSNLMVDRFAECDATDEKEYEKKQSKTQLSIQSIDTFAVIKFPFACWQ